MRDPRTVDLYLRRRFKCDSSAAAPPDVRKGFALPETVGILMGLRPMRAKKSFYV